MKIKKIFNEALESTDVFSINPFIYMNKKDAVSSKFS